MRNECATCGKVFDYRCYSKFCSDACREKYYTKKCPVCGKDFVQKTPKQQTCSQSCGQKYRRKTKEVVCIVCGKKSTRSTSAKFCSEQCAQQHYRNQRNEKRRQESKLYEYLRKEKQKQYNQQRNTASTMDRCVAYMVKHNCQYAKAHEAVLRGEE